MSLILLKALAVGLTVSQILTQPEVKTAFRPVDDRAEVRRILRAGCTHIRGVLEQEAPIFKKLDPAKFLDSQIESAKTLGQSTELIPGLEMSEAKTVYELFCVDTADTATGDKILSDVIGFYNLAMYNLPDPQKIASYRLSGFSHVSDFSGKPVADLFRSSRRNFLPLNEIPERVRKAFLSAEDRNFYDHGGIDEHGVLRAGLKSIMGGGEKREQGGSTITQQLVKNLLLSGDVTYERKMREMVLAQRLEKIMTKDQILELYLNYVLLGRSSWGVGLAAQSYFGKKVGELSIAETAFLAGMPKGPAFYNPDRNPDGSLERTRYVLARMKENKVITEEERASASTEAETMKRVAYTSPQANSAGYFLDELVDQVQKQVGINARESTLDIQSTVQPTVQAASEKALQENLFKFELNTGKAKFSGPEGNLDKAIKALTDKKDPTPWQTALSQFDAKFDDVKWPLGVVLSSGANIQVGLTNGKTYRLQGGPTGALGRLKVNDVIYVIPTREPGATTKNVATLGTAELRFTPVVQGAVVVMENATGRIISMVGGFSHKQSQWNRAVDMVRGPGSLAKPMTYLAALNWGLQPNTQVSNAPISVAPLPGGGNSDWHPSNYDRRETATVSMRKALEESLNIATARIAVEMAPTPEAGFNSIVDLMTDCGFNKTAPPHFWPVVLGAHETSLINVATCFATIANGGMRPVPHVVRKVSQDGRNLFDESSLQAVRMPHGNDVSFFQLRSLLQGVVVRGTGAALSQSLRDVLPPSRFPAPLSDFVAGKTGTTQSSNDAWFTGITQDLTIVVWTGYENASKDDRRTLSGATGATIAVPIFADVLRGTVKVYPLRRFEAPKAAVSQKVRPFVVDLQGYLQPIETGVAGSITDYIQIDASGTPMDTRDRMRNVQNY